MKPDPIVSGSVQHHLKTILMCLDRTRYFQHMQILNSGQKITCCRPYNVWVNWAQGMLYPLPLPPPFNGLPGEAGGGGEERACCIPIRHTTQKTGSSHLPIMPALLFLSNTVGTSIRTAVPYLFSRTQCCGSKYIEFGTRSFILAQFGSGVRLSILKKNSNYCWEFIFLLLKEYFYKTKPSIPARFNLDHDP